MSSLAKRWTAAQQAAKQRKSLVLLADHAAGGKNTEAAVRAVTTINPDNPKDQRIKRLCDTLGLDPTDIVDQHTALAISASVFFRTPSRVAVLSGSNS